MGALLQSQIFFFTSSVGFIILGVMAGVFLYYLIITMQAFSRIILRIESDIENIGDTTREMIDDLRDSSIFRFIFGGRSRHKKQNEKVTKGRKKKVNIKS